MTEISAFDLIIRQQPVRSRMCGVGERGKHLLSLLPFLFSFAIIQQQRQLRKAVAPIESVPVFSFLILHLHTLFIIFSSFAL